jgi:hypothetical protein
MSASGCYKYIPAELDQVPLDAHVNMMLSTEGQIDLRERAGIDRRELRGILVERSADAVLIAVQSTSAFPGEGPLYQRLDVRKRDVLRLDERVLDKPKVAGLIIGSVAATLGAILLITGEGGPGSRPGPGPDPPEHVTGWRFTLPVSIRLGVP